MAESVPVTVLEHTAVFEAPDNSTAVVTGNKNSGNDSRQVINVGTRTVNYVTFQKCAVPYPGAEQCSMQPANWYMQGMMKMHVLRSMEEVLSTKVMGAVTTHDDIDCIQHSIVLP